MNKIVKRIHPISLITIVIWLSSMSLLTMKVKSLAALFVLALILLVILSNDRGRSSMIRLGKLAPLLVMVFVLQILFRRGGNTYFSYGCFALTSLGLSIGTAISIRFLIIISGASILSHLNFVDFRNAFALIHLPEEISFMVSYVLRFVSTLRQRFVTAMLMLKSRGLDIARLSLARRFKIYRILALSVLVTSLSHSHMQAIALELRGFRSSGKRTELYLTKPGIADAFVAYGLIVLSFIVLSL